jgi:hypothetical protein
MPIRPYWGSNLTVSKDRKLVWKLDLYLIPWVSNPNNDAEAV